jgi:transcriptional regulator with XRE-family HTH domain
VTTSRNVELGAFLRSCRGRVEPLDVGLPPADVRRRVRGLRREEVAHLAGVSPDYYTRLEQGRQRTASPQVLDSLTRALRLTTDEQKHLYTLARVARADDVSKLASRTVGLRVQRLIDVMGDTPVMLCGPFVEVITANKAAAFLWADFNAMPAPERNGLRWMLLSRTARERYGRIWEEAASELIGMLRADAGHMPDDPRLAELVEELTSESPLFRRLWRDHLVSSWLHEKKILHHPSFGEMEFFNEFISLRSAPGRNLVVMMPADPATFQRALNRARSYEQAPELCSALSRRDALDSRAPW